MKNYKLTSFLKEFNDKRVYYDPRFQRRVVWGPSNVNSYFESLTKGWALNAIVVLDIDKCRDYSNEINNFSSAAYFQDKLDKGYKYISLDGQNRTKNTESVFNDEKTLSGDFLDSDNKLCKVENTFFKHLPQRLRDHLRTGCDVAVQTVERATNEECALIFQALNDGEPLNDQEMRQAINTPIADSVRHLSKKYTNMLERITKAKCIPRMEDDENIAKIMMALMESYQDKERTWGLSSADIDKFYELGCSYNTVRDPDCPYLESEVERVDNILSILSAVVLNQVNYPASKVVPKRSWWAVTLAAGWIHDNDYEIRDYKKFFNDLKKIDDTLATESVTAYAEERRKALEASQDTNDVSPDRFYFKWQNLPHIYANRKKRRDVLVGEIKKNLKSLTLRKKSDSISQAA